MEDLFSYTPVKTEYLASLSAPSIFKNSLHVAYFSFPWSRYVDSIIKSDFKTIKVCEEFLSRGFPKTHLLLCTTLQHIYIDPIIDKLAEVGVTDLFWCHARVGQNKINGVRIHPFPLHAVTFFSDHAYINSPSDCFRDNVNRRYLFSFIGAYIPGLYMTNVREHIFNLPISDEYLVRRNVDGWHFEDIVYNNGVNKNHIDDMRSLELRHRELVFVETLKDSIFSICPSGSGPNSIRFWESLAFGSIPVLMSDTLRLPGRVTEWNEGILRFPETPDTVASLPDTLRQIAKNTSHLTSLQKNAQLLWKKYGLNPYDTIFKEFIDAKNILKIINY